MILRELEVANWTVLELSASLGLPRTTVVAALRRLKDNGLARVVAYDRDESVVGARSYLRPVYGLGAGADAKRPRPLSGAQKQRRYRDRKSAILRVRRHVRLGMFDQLMRSA